MTPAQEALLREADQYVQVPRFDVSPQNWRAGLPVRLVEQLARELRAALADAARYRWLRKWEGQWIVVKEEPENKQLAGAALDAAIDAAREGK